AERNPKARRRQEAGQGVGGERESFAASLLHAGAMRLMTDVAERSAGVFLGVHLGKAGGLGAVFRVAADAEMRDVGQLGLHGDGIVGVFGQWTMAGLGVDVGVHAFCFGIRPLGMAPFTNLMAGVDDGTRGDFTEGITAIVSIAAETLWDEGAAKDEEEDQAERKDRSHAEEMDSVLQLHRCLL